MPKNAYKVTVDYVDEHFEDTFSADPEYAIPYAKSILFDAYWCNSEDIEWHLYELLPEGGWKELPL